MKLIVGLGNPGKKYNKTRHNTGFIAIEAIRAAMEEYDPSVWELSKKFNAEISGCAIGARKIILAKPMTFMNDSGIAVALIANFYKIPPRDIIIIHDDKDIPLGDLKIQLDRGSAGHHGVESIARHLGTEEFTRIRIGVASENKKKMSDTADFVLSNFGLFERGALQKSVAECARQVMQMLIQK